MNRQQRAVTEAVESILATVPGTPFYNEGKTAAMVLLDRDPYIVYVGQDGDTQSTYLSTIPPAEIARVTGLDPGDIGGWATGWEC